MSEGFEELWRGTAYPWECDHMGHVNVQHYAGKMAEASQWLMHLIGLSPPVMARDCRMLAPVEDYYRFHGEVHGGDILVIRGAVLDVGDSTITYALELRDAAADALCTSCYAIGAHWDLAADAAKPWPEHERRAATALIRNWDGDRAPRTPLTEPRIATSGDMATDRRRGCVDTYRGVLGAAECDSFGRMSRGALMARWSAAIWQLGNAVGVGPGFYRAGNATAGLYYHIRCFLPARAGDLQLALSGLTELGRTRHRYLHKLYDAATGALVATCDTMGVNIDTTTRRPVPWPAEVEAKSRARLITEPA